MRAMRESWRRLGFVQRQFFVPADAQDEVLGAVLSITGRRLLEIADDGHKTAQHVLMADRRRPAAVTPGEIAALQTEAAGVKRKRVQELLDAMLAHAREYHHNTHLTNSPPSGATRENLAQWYARALAHGWLLAGTYFSLKHELTKLKRRKETGAALTSPLARDHVNGL